MTTLSVARLTVSVIFAALYCCSAALGEPFVCVDSNTVQSIADGKFPAYRVPPQRGLQANRDLEFLWSATYRDTFSRPLDAFYGGSSFTELDKLGRSLCQISNTNVFKFPMTRIQALYDYLHAPRAYRPDFYNSDPQALVGLTVNVPSYPDVDRNHLDSYIFAPRFNGDPLYHGGAEYPGDGGDPFPTAPSAFVDRDNEDLSTGLTGDNVRTLNSLSIGGPRPSRVGAPDNTSWALPDSSAASTWSHEFQHAMNLISNNGGDLQELPVSVNEIYSLIAEALSGKPADAPAFDVPFVWNLLRSDGGQGNYSAWRSFASYLAYKFRGIDTTFAGRSDDLVWRWARSANRSVVPGLGLQLVNSACPECSLKTYFSGLSPNDRAQLLIHNWRVANYVRNPSLAEGQYGYPPHFGFDPVYNDGDFQNIDGSTYDDTVNVELQVKLSKLHLTQQLSLAGRPTNILNQGNTHALGLPQFGSDYWVIRSDSSLWSGNRDLVIRIQAEGTCTVRMLATAVAYSQQDLAGGQADTLWNHPEWAAAVYGPQWSDLAYGPGQASAGNLDLVVPDFGSTHKAVLVVLSLGATSQSSSNETVLPYRINMALRSGSYQTPNPMAVTTYSAPYSAWAPTWSPLGNEVAYVKANGDDRIYRRRLDGSPESLLVQPDQAATQFEPDWSPRGDWVALSQNYGLGAQQDVYAYNVVSGELRRLTTSVDFEYAPAFSPNGQKIAYAQSTNGSGGSALHRIRVVNLDGTGDQVLVEQGATSLSSVRWSPDGEDVYFVSSGDSLKSVRLSTHVITSRASLLYPLTSVDLHPGGGRMAAEQSWGRQGVTELRFRSNGSS